MLFFLSELLFFFFNDTATTEIYTLSLHDALPISVVDQFMEAFDKARKQDAKIAVALCVLLPDRKSTRLNSSHTVISYAVFCLKKKKKIKIRSAVRDAAAQDLITSTAYCAHEPSVA